MTALPTPISVLADTLQDLVTVADTLRKEVRRLEAADARGELSEVLRRGRFPLSPPGSLRDEQERLLKERHCDPATKAIGLTRSLREQARHVIHALPAASTWTDDRTKPAQERWTVEVADEVRGLASCPYRGQPDDAYMSDLPWPDQGISEAIGGFVNRLGRRLDQVVAIGRVMADPIEVHNHALPGDLGVLDAMEARALLQLGEREFWGVDELPQDIDADALRCLDDRGLVEARYVVMQNRSPEPWTPSRSAWFSPIAKPEIAGTWERILARRDRSSRSHPAEIRISERGKAVVARHLRRADSAQEIADRTEARSAPASKPSSPPPSYKFSLRGDFWDLRFGDEAAHVKNSTGMKRLAELLSRPGKFVEAFDLSGGDTREDAGADPVHDPQSRQRLKEAEENIAEILSDIEEAEADGDHERAESLRANDLAEEQSVVSELTSGVGLGGRPRQLGGTDRDRARQRVSTSLTRAYKAIRNARMPRLAEHLESVVRMDGAAFAYAPSEPIDWDMT
ncbi:MAG: hypothetical protein DYG93_07660 [Leptolyngbya sp. PLA2]|nr:hypothetical protein [Leptolyngbya sp.]MCE7971523.1 hypothetical protein [Leptolyngbya sp. PL-A2]MCQ3940737.1 hypothetical protein [cyanobacterium CYA1]MDL1903707.1 hypothetical protein [Synechococcales cyanobacterium CNB]